MRITPFKWITFWVALALILAGMLLSPLLPDLAVRGFGAGVQLLSGWLYRYDIARISVRKSGLTRYIGVCRLSGYFWLIVCGLTAIFAGAVAAGPVYDALLHAAFLGFVFSMIFKPCPGDLSGDPGTSGPVSQYLLQPPATITAFPGAADCRRLAELVSRPVLGCDRQRGCDSALFGQYGQRGGAQRSLKN